MKKSDNPNQIPGNEEFPAREENSAPVTDNGNGTPMEPEITAPDVQNEIIESPKAENIPSGPEEIPAREEMPADIPPLEKPVPEPAEEQPEALPEEDQPESLPEEDPAPGEMEALHLEEPSEAEVEEAAEHAQETEEDFSNLTRTQLVDMLEKAVHEPDVNTVKNRIALIKVTYLRKKKEENLSHYEEQTQEEAEPKVEAPVIEDELDTRFNEYFNIYRANKARFTEEQEKIKQENLKKKNNILDELRILVNSEETLKKTYDEFKNLQERWKEIGLVPRSEINNLWQNYHFLVEKFFDKVKLNKELKDLDLKKNFEAKIALCEKTEELLLEPSLIKSFKQLQKYHEEWKEIGPVPADKKDEIWERFKNATDRINELRRQHYAKVEEEQQKNLETKTALCEKAEEVLALHNETIREWQDNTAKVNELLKIWKSIGPVPQKLNTSIWNRFKGALDNFFANKKEFFDKLKDQQIHNYNLKLDICVQAEALKNSTDWKKTSNELIKLQNQWKNIGPVPRKNSDKIWKRFRAACDEFFNAKTAYFANVQTHEQENLEKKIDLMKRLREYQFSGNKTENLTVLKNFQREWSEIGFIPLKEKDRLQSEFRALINEHLDRLKLSETEMSVMNYEARMESMKNDPQGRKIMSKERDTLASRISKMKEDIHLWENNIGFLANSKNAAILREEFEQKINKAKNEVKVLEAKLKMLRNQG